MVNEKSQNKVKTSEKDDGVPTYHMENMNKKLPKSGVREDKNAPSAQSVKSVSSDRSELNNSSEMKDDKKDKIFTSKDVILGLINLVTIILLVIFIVKLPEKATELKNLKINQLKNESASLLPPSEIEDAVSKADKLEELFLDQSGIVDFVNEVEKLKVEGGAIQKVSFASQKPVKDKTGYLGVPVVIELRGSWESIGIDIQKIESLPYLFRAASIDAETIPDNPGVIDFKYGGFLYVNDELGEN